MEWQAITATCSTVSTVIVIIGASVAWRQWREASASRKLAATLAFIGRFQDGTLRGLKAYLKRNTFAIKEALDSPTPLSRLDDLLVQNDGRYGAPSSLADLRKSFADLEFIAILCLNDSIPRTLEQAYFAPTIAGYWKAILPVVIAIREDQTSVVYLQHVEAFVKMVADGTLHERKLHRMKREALHQLSTRGSDGGRVRMEEIDGAARRDLTLPS